MKNKGKISKFHLEGMEHASDTLSMAFTRYGKGKRALMFLEGVQAKMSLICRELKEKNKKKK